MFNIALNTFREIVRNKFLYLILIFAFALIVFSLILWNLSMWENSKIIVDFWIAMIEIFWLLWVLFVWSQLLFNEVNGKTIFLILSKPIKRYEFILWKFFWFSMVIIVMTLLQSLLFLWILMLKWIPITWLILFSLVFIFFKLEIILALVLFFSTFMSNILTILMAFISYIVWWSYTIIQDLIQRWWNEILIIATRVIWTIFPPIESLNLKDMIWWVIDITSNYLVINTIYSLMYLSLILFFTVFLFNNKKFEN